MKEVGKTWSFNAINMIVEKDSQDHPNIRMAIQDILDASGTYAYYGGLTAYYRELRGVLLSGYADRLIPLIGSGYHALISDQGTEGNYLITGCKPERLQALNMPSAVYRVVLDLLKSSVIPPLVWSVYVGTISAGVYYSSNFSSDSSHPTWIAINDGLPTLDLHKFGIDAEDPENYQYVHRNTATDDEIWRRKEGGSWSKIMDNTIATALVGTTVYVEDFCPNRITGGKIHVLCATRTAGSGGSAYVLKSSDHGDTWGYNSARGEAYGVDGIQAYGNRIAFNRSAKLLSGWEVEYSLDGGSSWSATQRKGSSQAADQKAVISRADTYYYFAAWNSGFSNFAMANVQPPNAAAWVLMGGVADINRKMSRQDLLWFHPTIGGTVRYIQEGSWSPKVHSFMEETVTHFTGFETETEFEKLYNINSLAWRVDDDDSNWIIYGSSGYTALNQDADYQPTPHIILIADASINIVDVTGKAGANAATSPYTDSIPRTCGGPCVDGIQVIT